jgi:purine-binding chemotaxis protein CheW
MTMTKPTFEAQYVTFALGSEVFAVPVTVVREILDFEPSFRIPSGPDYLMGLRNVRGQGVPVIDLRLKLGLAPTAPTAQTRVLVVDVTVAERPLTLGLVADRVFEVAAFRGDQIESAPDIGIRWNSDYIDGVVRRDSGFVVLIDLARLLSANDAFALTGAQRREAVA